MNKSFSNQASSKSNKKSDGKNSNLPQLAIRDNLRFPANKNLFSPAKNQDAKMPMRKTYHSSTKLENSKRQRDQNPQNSLRSSQMFFTQRLSKKFEAQLNELRQQQQIREQKSIQKKLQFQQKKHLKEHFLLKQKLNVLKEIQFRKNQRQRMRQIEQKRKIQERQFIHGCNSAKFSMLRNLHRHVKNQQIGLANQKLRETEHLLNFKQEEALKARQNHEKLLQSRLIFLLNNKVGNDPEEFLQKRMTCRLFVGRNSSVRQNSNSLSPKRN